MSKIQLTSQYLFLVSLLETMLITKWPVDSHTVFASASNVVFFLAVCGLFSSIFYFVKAKVTYTALTPTFWIHSLNLRFFFLGLVYVKTSIYVYCSLGFLLYRLASYTLKRGNSRVLHRYFFDCIFLSNILLALNILFQKKLFYLISISTSRVLFKSSHIINLIFSNFSLFLYVCTYY